eukprot:2146163-Pyramimonas_sp.AAC.1
MGRSMLASPTSRATEKGSPTALSTMPEESGGDFSGNIQQATWAARREVEGAEDLALELEAMESDASQQMINAA